MVILLRDPQRLTIRASAEVSQAERTTTCSCGKYACDGDVGCAVGIALCYRSNLELSEIATDALVSDRGRDTGTRCHRVAGEVTLPRLPQIVACRFPALRSSELDSPRNRSFAAICSRPVAMANGSSLCIEGRILSLNRAHVSHEQLNSRRRLLCIAKILSGSEINSLHTFLSRSICYDWCSCSATSSYGLACLPAACNRIEACSWKISPCGNSWRC